MLKIAGDDALDWRRKMTRVYAQYVGYSAFDAQYVGTVEDTPEVVTEVLRAVKEVISVEIYGDEVILYVPRPF